MGKRLYVGNLSYNVTNSSLEELFAPFGTVSKAEVIQDRDSGRSKGFAFVEMADDNAAQAAIQGLNEKEHDGRALTVNEAKPARRAQWQPWRLRSPLREQSIDECNGRREPSQGVPSAFYFGFSTVDFLGGDAHCRFRLILTDAA